MRQDCASVFWVRRMRQTLRGSPHYVHGSVLGLYSSSTPHKKAWLIYSWNSWGESVRFLEPSNQYIWSSLWSSECTICDRKSITMYTSHTYVRRCSPALKRSHPAVLPHSYLDAYYFVRKRNKIISFGETIEKCRSLGIRWQDVSWYRFWGAVWKLLEKLVLTAI